MVITRGSTLNATTTLMVEECCECHMLFAMPYELMSRLRADRKSFYCPAGHEQWYAGKTAEQRAAEAERLLELRTRSLEIRDRDLALTQQRLSRTQRRLSATQGVVTRTKRRIAHGVCPCCTRSFKDLAAHMGNKHPGYVAEA